MTDAPTPPAAAQPAPAAPLTPAEDKQWASFAHFGGAAVLFWAGWLPPLIIWLVFRERGSLTNQEGKESLNFQITVTGLLIINVILGSILSVVTLGIWWFVQMLIHAVIVIGAAIFAIIGGTRVNSGGTYRYPFAIRFIK